MIRVIYLSEDGHKFEYKSEKKNKEEVIAEGYNKLKELHYDKFGYVLKEAEDIQEEFS